jgi:hypothetical protein
MKVEHTHKSKTGLCFDSKRMLKIAADGFLVYRKVIANGQLEDRLKGRVQVEPAYSFQEFRFIVRTAQG